MVIIVAADPWFKLNPKTFLNNFLKHICIQFRYRIFFLKDKKVLKIFGPRTKRTKKAIRLFNRTPQISVKQTLKKL